MITPRTLLHARHIARVRADERRDEAGPPPIEAPAESSSPSLVEASAESG